MQRYDPAVIRLAKHVGPLPYRELSDVYLLGRYLFGVRAVQDPMYLLARASQSQILGLRLEIAANNTRFDSLIRDIYLTKKSLSALGANLRSVARDRRFFSRRACFDDVVVNQTSGSVDTTTLLPLPLLPNSFCRFLDSQG